MGMRDLDASTSQARERRVNCKLSKDNSFSGNFLHFRISLNPLFETFKGIVIYIILLHLLSKDIFGII